MSTQSVKFRCLVQMFWTSFPHEPLLCDWQWCISIKINWEIFFSKDHALFFVQWMTKCPLNTSESRIQFQALKWKCLRFFWVNDNFCLACSCHKRKVVPFTDICQNSSHFLSDSYLMPVFSTTYVNFILCHIFLQWVCFLDLCSLRCKASGK